MEREFGTRAEDGEVAITLNAVLSLEQSQLATTVVILIRTESEEARTFGEAIAISC